MCDRPVYLLDIELLSLSHTACNLLYQTVEIVGEQSRGTVWVEKDLKDQQFSAPSGDTGATLVILRSSLTHETSLDLCFHFFHPDHGMRALLERRGVLKAFKIA